MSFWKSAVEGFGSVGLRREHAFCKSTSIEGVDRIFTKFW